MNDRRRALGQRGEDAAAAYLERQGFTVVERNWRTSAGEVDIICVDGDDLVFVEVKTRKSETKGTPAEAITPVKQRRYERLAREYVAQSGLDDVSVRFDVVAILVTAKDRALLRHHRAAFVVGE